MQWLAAALQLIKLTSMIVGWMERTTARADGFREAVALEMEARARAARKGLKIDAGIDKMSDAELDGALARYRRGPV